MKRFILDLGCGGGAKYHHLKKRGRYVGIDISSADLRFSRRMHPEGHFLRAESGALPLKDASIEEAHLYDVLEHIDRREEAFRHLHRCIAPGGLLVVEIPYWKSEEMLVRALPSYLDEVGHKGIVRAEELRRLAHGRFRLVKTRKKHGMQNLLLRYYIAGGGHVESQAGVFSNDIRFLDLVTHLFSEDLFFLRIFKVIPVWLFFPVWLFTLPVGMVVSRVFPKTIRYEFRREG